jgi:hypothetical protein
VGGDAPAAGHRSRGAKRQVAVLLVCLAAAFAAGCGDSDDAGDSGSSALGSPDVQTTARETDCTDWNDATVEERQIIVESIAEFEGGAPTGTTGRTLPDDEAYELFGRFCDKDYAAAFKLYKLYVRAAAFAGSEP